jgi:hypothetical protein
MHIAFVFFCSRLRVRHKGEEQRTVACLIMDMVTHPSGMYTTSFVLQDALSGVDSFQRSAALWLRGLHDDGPRMCKETTAPLCPLSQAQLHTFDVDALVESTCMHDDVACAAASAAAAAGAESQCGCEGQLPDAHSSRHVDSCLGLNDAIDADYTFQCFGALTNESCTQKEASRVHSVTSDHACGVTQMRMASGSAGERACAPTEDLANEGAVDPSSRSNGGCLLETARTDEGFIEAAQPQKRAGEVDGRRDRASRHACDTPQFPCIRNAMARAFNFAVVQTSGVEGVAADFEATLRVSQEAAAATCAHATRHCNMSRCEGIAACDLLQVSEEAGFSGDGRHAACAADVMCSQHASPQQIRGGGILDATSHRRAQLGRHGGGPVTAHTADSRGDVEERAEKSAPYEPFQCMTCAKEKQKTQKLLGESGEVYDAAQHALTKIQDVHVSDELMHFEFWGPFWELTEVRAAFLPFTLWLLMKQCCRMHEVHAGAACGAAGILLRLGAAPLGRSRPVAGRRR